MSFIYSGIYLASNIIIPTSCMVYSQLHNFCTMTLKEAKNSQNSTQRSFQIPSNTTSDGKTHKDSPSGLTYQCSYGKWAMLIVLMAIFSLLNSMFSKSLTVTFLGLILKMIIIYSPQSFTHSIQDIIQKSHLQIHLSTLHSKFLQLYLEISERINFYIVFYLTREREQQLNVLIHMKDTVSRMQLQLEENEDIKNRSFIVAVKKMQSMPKKTKSYQNIGIQCDLMKGSSQVGKQLLQLLQKKTFPKQRPQKASFSKIQQPTKDRFTQENKQTKKSQIYPARSQSLQEKVQKMKSSMTLPTSEKKSINQVQVKDTPFMIKRSQTDIGEQFESQQNSPKRQRENNHITWTGTRTEKPTNKPENITSSFSPQCSREVIYEENSSSTARNLKDGAVLEMGISQKSDSQNNNTLNSVLNQEIKESEILPAGLSISQIAQNPLHPFQLNLSSLSNPLILSNKTTQSKILPTSMTASNDKHIIQSVKRQSPSLVKEQMNNLSNKMSNFSQPNTIISNAGEKFSEQSSIPNKHEVSISESDYSDMFDSEDDQEEPKLEIKVEAIFQNERQNGLKPRLEICYIELYSNDDVKFMTMHDKPFFSGKLIKMFKKPENYYDLVIRQKSESKQQKNLAEITKKIKFRGQARPFMKFIEKV